MTQALRLQVPEGQEFPDIQTEHICYWKDRDGLWFVYLPGAGVGVLSLHQVEEHPDGTITVRPSILLESHRGQAHGFLERGQWRDV